MLQEKHFLHLNQTPFFTKDCELMSQPSRKELLIYGFIREYKALLNPKKIIPVEIIKLFYAFYSIVLNIFLINKKKAEFYAINIEYNYYSKIIPQINNVNNLSCLSGPFCHIENISSSLKIKNDNIIKNKRYDSIICFNNHGNYGRESYPCVLFFESNKIIMNNNNIEYNSHISTN